MKIIMYHYVRPHLRNASLNIKARSVSEFDGQLKYFLNHYCIVGPDDVIGVMAGGKPFPEDWVLLTFDDGIVDHYTHVLPLLLKYRLKAMFFPPVAAVRDKVMLDVHKIQYLLASTTPRTASDALLTSLSSFGYGEMDVEGLKKKFYCSSRFDDADAMFVKNVLQKGLPQPMRSQVVAELFSKFVSANESDLAKELYLTKAQCREMVQCGMHFGSHGFRHLWMENLAKSEQELEIKESISFLHEIYDGLASPVFTMCYPYGSYNSDTVETLEKNGFTLGLTSRVGEADLLKEGRFELSRYDTNDFPCSVT